MSCCKCPPDWISSSPTILVIASPFLNGNVVESEGIDFHGGKYNALRIYNIHMQENECKDIVRDATLKLVGYTAFRRGQRSTLNERATTMLQSSLVERSKMA